MDKKEFKEQAIKALKGRIEELQSGEVKWNVGNQHDVYVCESSLKHMTEEKLEEAFNIYVEDVNGDWFTEWSYHDYSNFFSEF